MYTPRSGRKFVTELGRKIHKLPPAEEKKWNQSISPIIIDYQSKMIERGLPGMKAVELLRELIAEYSKVY